MGTQLGWHDKRKLQIDIRNHDFATLVNGCCFMSLGYTRNCHGEHSTSSKSVIDLRGTNYKIANAQNCTSQCSGGCSSENADNLSCGQWKLWGYKSAMEISCTHSGQRCAISCGGYAGGCEIEKNYLQLAPLENEEKSVCKDHIGTIATIRNDTITCSSVESDILKKNEKEEKEQEIRCNKSMRDWFEEHDAVPGPNISRDMYAKDLCPLVFKDMCSTCATGKSNLRGDCKDHIGTIATLNLWGTNYTMTCSSVESEILKKKEKEEKEQERRCNKPMRDWMEKQGAVLGPNISPDMYARDLCPLVHKDICTTCATGNSDSNSWDRSAASQQASNMCFLAVLLLL